MQCGARDFAVGVRELFDNVCHGAIEVCVEDSGMDVAFAAHRGRIAKTFGDRRDGLDDILFELCGGVTGLKLAQCKASEDSPCPSAEVLGCEVLLGDLEEIVVDVGGVDCVRVSVVIEVLKELVAGGVAAGFDDACEAAVGEVNGVADAAFAFEVEGERGALDFDVPSLHRSESVRLVFARIFGIAYTDEGGFKQANDGGENFFAGQAGEAKVVLDPLANGWKSVAEVKHVLIFGFVADRAPERMVAALFSTARVATGRLEMTVRERANPDGTPSGWDGERLNAGQGFSVADRVAFGIEVSKAVANALTRNAGACVVNVT